MFDDLITIENICEACEDDTADKPCKAPCERWNELLSKTLKGEE